MMQGNRVTVSGTLNYNYQQIRDASVRGEKPDINALAAKDKNSATVMVWNYHDDNKIAPPELVVVKISGLPASAQLHHYRVDQEHSNSYETWKKMGSPKQPDAAQIAVLEKAGQLQLLSSPEWIHTKKGEITIRMMLPRQGVSLLKFNW